MKVGAAKIALVDLGQATGANSVFGVLSHWNITSMLGNGAAFLDPLKRSRPRKKRTSTLL